MAERSSGVQAPGIAQMLSAQLADLGPSRLERAVARANFMSRIRETGRPRGPAVTSRCEREGLCAEVCAPGAIRVTGGPDGSWEVDWSRCTLCGLCIDACDRSALDVAEARTA